MGSSSTSSTNQSSTSPWAAAQPEVNGLLGQLQGLIPNSGATAATTGAINQLTANGQAGNPYASAVGNVATNLLNGGGATSQNGALQSNLQTYQNETSPLASNTNYNPYDTPGFAAALTTSDNNLANTVNGEFAAAGRTGSGMNVQTLAQGIAQGNSQAIANQYNQNVLNQQNAASAQYGAGNTTSGLISTNNQNANTNQQNGITASNDALTAENWGPQSVIAAQELGQQIPAQNLGLLANIGIPLAQLGTNSSGSSTTQSNPSLLSDFASLAPLFSSSNGGTSAAMGMGQAAAGLGSGILGWLSAI